MNSTHEDAMVDAKKAERRQAGGGARVIAFYLPQFHPIPENDEWWGKGFTEWTNVAKAKPLFKGHYQPHLPADLGFYDLRVPEVQEAQADLARSHGIEGFCYWHYWFHGKRLLERPFEAVLASGKPDFPFCLAWANEPWARTWDGNSQECLMGQNYSKADDLRHTQWLAQAFADPRYIRVEGRPLFLIYRPSALPEPIRTTDTLRAECVRLGVREPYLVGINLHSPRVDMRTLGFDLTEHHGPLLAALPQVFDNRWRLARLQRNMRHGVCSGKLKIYSYADALQWMAKHRPEFPHYPCFFMPWDNTPRAGRRAFIMTDGTPQLFEQGLREVVTTVCNKNPDHRIIFINAWNEWAEGMHLEPDQKFGRGFLEAISRVIASVPTSTPVSPEIVTVPAPVEPYNNTMSSPSSRHKTNRRPRTAGRPRILFVAMADSVHTARWINQLAGTGWDVHLFPVENGSVHSSLSDVTVHDFIGRRPAGLNTGVRLVNGIFPFLKIGWPLSRGAGLAKRLARRCHPPLGDRAWRLARTIRRLEPKIVHSLEMQHAGYLTLEARRHLDGKFPTWIVANWGSDIYLFGRLKEHRERIKAVLAACDFYNCECHRDAALARTFGYKGKILAGLPNTGGIEPTKLRELRQPGPPSGRRLILLKGYQTWAGRALAGLRALRLAADVLKGYRIGVYLAGDESVRISAELLEHESGIPVEMIPSCSHEEMLRWHGRARVSIGLSISDAISTSFLEAIMMGSFPIQSNTSCANEWIKCGETGFLVPPEDPQVIADAIRRAVTDDELVDRAAEINAQTVRERLDQSVIRPQVVAMYEKVAAQAARKGKSNRV